ncbi:DUF6207 family protein [Streptomyces sp. NPDC057445]|uniref:DUF6207 family protein n=1 Tax=Streptomyces sp. NPDC057445 TaxID=3346136 RepID=UPI0036BE41EC
MRCSWHSTTFWTCLINTCCPSSASSDTQTSEPGSVVVDLTAHDEAPAKAVMAGLEQLWATRRRVMRARV